MHLYRLGIPGLDIEEKYQNILLNYGREVDTISKIYSRQRTDPVIPRNTPPTAGKFSLPDACQQGFSKPLTGETLSCSIEKGGFLATKVKPYFPKFRRNFLSIFGENQKSLYPNSVAFFR